MDIWLLVQGAPSLYPNLLAEIQECVGDGRGDRGEGEPICHRERSWQEKGTIHSVSLDVNS